MIAAFRHLGPGETDAELLGVAASAGSAAWGIAWVAGGLQVPPCAFHAITGCPCPTCGATRCLLALAHGRVLEAAGWNPLVFAGLVGIALLNVYAAAVLALGLPRIRVSVQRMGARALQAVAVVLLIGNWGYEIWRGV